MTRDETVALFFQGRQAWNAWAERLLVQKKVLQDRGHWTVARNLTGDIDMKNDDTLTWITAATADFSRCLFIARGFDGGKTGMGEVKEKIAMSASSLKSIPLDADVVDFSGFVFPGPADFTNTTFIGDAVSGKVRFENASFLGEAIFHYANFLGPADFTSANFAGQAIFRDATFSGTADFVIANFRAAAVFRNAIFFRPAVFRDTTFSGTVDNRTVTFKHATIFTGAKFFAESDFRAIKAERTFNMTGVSFAEVPAFNQADFNQAPDLDDVSFPLPRFWPAGKVDLIAKYRAIRRMAIQGADYEREHMTLKGELRSRRWKLDKFWHPGLWLGLLYDGVADCGRSIMRPLALWIAFIVAFAVFYWQRSAGISASCANKDYVFIQALYLSAKNALVLFGGPRDARANQAYLCLYDGSAEQPHIPLSVTFMEMLAQTPASAVLIFLFLLAVKNRYKIK